MNLSTSVFDILISIVIIAGAFFIANRTYNKHIENTWYYAYYKKALFARIAFSIAFILVYMYYYGGGDTHYYYTGAQSLVRLFTKDFSAAFRILLGERTPELRSLFDASTGSPMYFRDPNAWAVCRFTVPFYLLGFGSYWGTTLAMSIVLFIPFWNFYKMLCRMYPKNRNTMAIALFFVPSVLFWSSGILKDVWCLAAVLQLYMSVYYMFYRRHKVLFNMLNYVFWSYILISIRPFVFYTALASTLLWVGFWWLSHIKSTMIKTVAVPLILGIFLLGIMYVISSMGSVAEGKYATTESMLSHAVIIQQDLKQDYYGDNSFDIGTFDATIPSMLSKVPIALFSGLFRPLLWEGSSLFLLISALEAAALLVFFVYLLIRTRIVGFFRIIAGDTFLSSLLIFVSLSAFFTGLTIANFGALVRYRIVYLPFFCILLFRVLYIVKQKVE
ncbi:MAG: hypothetical protein LBM68_03195 [Bacteroidales bacterium]|jgi:hypothetical protein|nr:hypothetical protein [Bacteroidales bacterium]